MRFLIVWILLAMGVGAFGVQAQTNPLGSEYGWVTVASGFNSPVFVTDDGTGRLFVMEQAGVIFIVRDGVYDDTQPFLDVSRLLTNDVFQGGYTERGLLGLAFHPEFNDNGLFYITYSDRNGRLVLVRYHATGDFADADTRTEILSIDHPQYDHNGGMIAFGADGYLYMGVGDGGSQGDDAGETSQDLTTLLGKMLRIDVDGKPPYAIPPDNPFVGVEDAKPEIWAYGLRNPWRFSFDSATGDLFIGDVGQGEYEEIDVQPAGEGGANYGWNQYEGMHPYHDAEAPENMTLPVAEYPHSVGCAVTGGYVYRGESLPELDGVYFFGDYCSGRIWSMVRSESGRWLVEPFMETGRTISSFGQDAAGELYLVDFKGDILRLARAE